MPANRELVSKAMIYPPRSGKGVGVEEDSSTAPDDRNDVEGRKMHVEGEMKEEVDVLMSIRFFPKRTSKAKADA